MADNVSDALKNLNKNLKEADTNLATLSKNFHTVFAEAVRRAAQDANADISQMFNAMVGKVKAKDASKLKMLFELVDEHGAEITPQTLKAKIDRIANASVNKEGTKIHLGFEWVDYDKAMAQLERLRQQYKLLKDLPGAYDTALRLSNQSVGGATAGGTALGRARAKEMAEVQKYTKLANDELLRQQQIEDTIAKIRERGGRSAKFEGERKSIEQLNQMLDESRRRVEAYQRTLRGFGSRGQAAAAGFGGDGTAAALKKQEQNFIRLNRLLNDRRKLEAQIKAQGGTATAEQTRYQNALNNAIQRCVDTMRKLETAHKGVTREAAQNTMEQRMRRNKETVDRLNGSLNNTRDGLSRLLPAIYRLGTAFGIAFSAQGLVQFGRKLVETRGEFELQQVALRSILQNKQLADEIWDKTMQAALQSPFTAMQLTKYTKQLAAYRIETEKLFDTTKRLADVSAGLGVDMQRLILAYGQVKAANYLRASEIRQFTEAGVNILGELSSYLSKMNGEVISTAQVMEMVQKRMVTFSDVEAIFKRMTDAGGIFYDMQYVQSQTVKGQINKLHDAYDQMLNSIGKSNQGALKEFVSILNKIVKNWREWKTALDLIVWSSLITAVAKFARGLFSLNATAIVTSKSFNALTVAGARLNITLSKLGVLLAANWWILPVTALAAVGTALYNHSKAVKDINQKYEDLMYRAFETQKKLDDYSTSIQKNLDVMKRAKKWTDEYNKANDENAEIIAKIKSDYPELLKGIDLQKDGYQKLIEKIREYNEELEDQIRLEYAARHADGTDDLETNLNKLKERQREREMKFLENREAAEREYLKLKAEGREEDENMWLKRIRLAKTAEEQVAVFGEVTRDWTLIPSGDPRYNSKENKDATALTRAGSEYSAPYGFSSHPIDKNIKKEALLFNQMIRTQLQKVNSDLGDDIQVFIANNKAAIDTLFKNQEGEGWKLLNKRITKFFSAKGATDAKSREYIQNLLNQYLLIPIQLDWGNNDEDANRRAEEAEKQSKIDAAWRKRIQLLEEMRRRYEELSKSAYGYAKSDKEVRKAFADSFRDVFQGTGISMDQIDFTSMESMMRSFEFLRKQAEAGKGGRPIKTVLDEIQKKADSSEAKIALDVEVKVREDFSREIEKMFTNYELTLELQGLNISPDMAQDIFPELDLTTLGDLQDRMQEFFKNRQTQDENGNVLFSETDLKEYRKWADKIDAAILKDRKEKAKKYSKYLEKEYSERAKLEMQYANDVAFVKSNFSNETQRDNIVANITRKYQNDLNELNWKSFKESDFYVEMMDDISSLPKEYMQMMLVKIEEILQHPETLSPRALKEAINARQKVLEAQMNLEPLDVMRSSLSTINQAKNEVGGVSWKDTKEKINQQIAATQEEINQLEEEARCWDEVAAKMQVYEDAALAVSEAKGKLSTETRSLVDEQGSENVVADYQQKINANNVKIQELEAKGKRNLAPDEQDQLNALRETNGYYERQIALIQRLIALEEQLGSIRQMQAGTDAEAQRGEGGVGTAAAARGRAQESRDEAKTPKQKIQNLKQYLKAFTNFDAAFAKFNAAINSTLNAVAGMGNAFYDMFDALGGKTDALTEGWKEFGNTMISSITNALTMIPMMVAAFTAAGIAINSAMGIIGLIAEALNLLMTAITAISKLHDAGYEKEIEKQQEKIDELKDAYERLEKQIEKTWTTMAYIDTYNQQVENIKQQIEALEAQRSAENSKKNTDEDKIREYGDSIQEAYDELEELEQKRIEVFGGLGEVNYRSAAEEFVSAWKDAFLETGDGLEALQEHFDEFLQEWFVKQATMRIAGAMLERTFRMIDESVNESSEGGVAVTMAELQAIRDEFAAQAPLISEALEELAGMWYLGNGEGSLSGLAAGIQGMTEEQANILEAYWNSVRMYTANLDGNVERIANILGAGGSATNPQLQQLQIIAQHTQAIHTLLDNVTRSGHPQGGLGIKVFNN